MKYAPHLLNIYDKVRRMTNTARKLVNQSNLTPLTKLLQTGKD
jgi:hypothetical protein